MKGSRKATFFTFNEDVNGIYHSQVVDVVKHLNLLGINVKVFAIFSPRSYFANRKKLLALLPGSLVFPSISKTKNWEFNRYWLKFFRKNFYNSTVICRGVLATNLAIKENVHSKIVYDGRGAVWAEQKEYKVYEGTGIDLNLFTIEKEAVNKSDRQIAVSSRLIDYWREFYQYNKNDYQVIPCTLKGEIENYVSEIPIEVKSFLDASHKKIKIVFSGGKGKWQQIEKISEFSESQLKKNKNLAFLFLCPQTEELDALRSRFPKNVFNSFVEVNEVHSILLECDYGIILRENNLTNRVASPVKIAEYLYAGLKLIISTHIGDYSQIIKENNLGISLSSINDEVLIEKPTIEEKLRITEFAKTNLVKSCYNYNALFD